MQEKSTKQLEALALTAGQVVGDMEDTPAIADVPLLCSAVLVKDEVIAMLEHKAQQIGAFPLAHTTHVPSAEFAFLLLSACCCLSPVE